MVATSRMRKIVIEIKFLTHTGTRLAPFRLSQLAGSLNQLAKTRGVTVQRRSANGNFVVNRLGCRALQGSDVY